MRTPQKSSIISIYFFPPFCFARLAVHLSNRPLQAMDITQDWQRLKRWSGRARMARLPRGSGIIQTFTSRRACPLASDWKKSKAAQLYPTWGMASRLLHLPLSMCRILSWGAFTSSATMSQRRIRARSQRRTGQYVDTNRILDCPSTPWKARLMWSVRRDERNQR